uniref:Uncharacterized protein n=1 Tax=Salmo trutta TaxID=8032 RepID=A0A673WZL5_SALTR
MNMYGDLVMDTAPEEWTENVSYPWGNFICMLSSVFVCLFVYTVYVVL